MSDNQHAEMPYERFNACGAGALTNTELIAIVLRTGSSRGNVMKLAEEVLQIRENPSGSLSVLHDVSKEELMELDGIGEVKAIRLLAVLELSRRLASESVLKGDTHLVCDEPSAVAGYYMESMRHEKQERILLLLLDSRLGLIRSETVSIGTANMSICSIRDIFSRAVKSGAVSIILMHNHPSGNPEPSYQDLELTLHVKEAGEMMDIRLLDHLVIGDLCYVSMKESGILDHIEDIVKERREATWDCSEEERRIPGPETSVNRRNSGTPAF